YVASIYEETGANVISKTYTVSSADTWEFKSIIFPGLTSASISATTGTGLRIWWGLGAGSDYTGGSNDAWTSGATNWFEGQAVNVLDSTSNTFFLTGVQLEVGTNASDFEHRSFGEELALCQRYFFKLTDISGDGAGTFGQRYNNDSAKRTIEILYPTTMRTSPTLTVTCPNTVDANYIQPDGSTSVISGVNTAYATYFTAFQASAEL
ncbi:MAG: hypothetical protein VXY99_15160, partial [Pseudomonadota bacterium]|nr:hypothetical protein [Pseudomonadota bacterium]